MVARKPAEPALHDRSDQPPWGVPVSRVRSVDPFEIIGTSAEIQAMLDRIDRYARTRDVVRVEGESGTGKELAARRLHLVRGLTGEFVARDCGALTESLAESELFGHVHGAFTGAVARDGAFRAARGGTLFLDEIGKLSRALQVKLMRALTRFGTFKPVGGDREVPVETCVVVDEQRAGSIVRSNRGRSYRDLYHRIDVLHVTVPPLRDRESDIAPVLEAFFGEKHLDLAIEADALELLQAGRWQGNVRELRRTAWLGSSLKLTATRSG